MIKEEIGYEVRFASISKISKDIKHFVLNLGTIQLKKFNSANKIKKFLSTNLKFEEIREVLREDEKTDIFEESVKFEVFMEEINISEKFKKKQEKICTHDYENFYEHVRSIVPQLNMFFIEQNP